MGGPGSGKGTQGSRIADKYNLYHISTGEVLRNEIASGSDLGKLADSYISKGNLIPDELMLRILDDILLRHAHDKEGVIFDGFPRTIAQAEALSDLLKKHGGELDAVIDLDVPEDVLITRMLKRGEETGRADDNIDTIKNRLSVYHERTEPLRGHYKDKGKYMPVDGSGTIEEIFEKLVESLDKAL